MDNKTKFRNLVKQSGLSLTEVAKVLETPYSTVKKWHAIGCSKVPLHTVWAMKQYNEESSEHGYIKDPPFKELVELEKLFVSALHIGETDLMIHVEKETDYNSQNISKFMKQAGFSDDVSLLTHKMWWCYKQRVNSMGKSHCDFKDCLKRVICSFKTK